MQIEMINIDAIKPYDKNPRKNQKAVPAVAKSIEAFGFKVPIIVDKNHTIIAGHTRWKAAQSLGMNQVPCIIADDLSPEQVRAFRIADNKVAEIAEWDEALLAQELNDLKDLFDWQGFDINLDEMKLSGEPEEDDFDLDEELAKVTQPNAKMGDIYQLGNHRLMCGDSTKDSDINLLMNGRDCDLVVTDPPYNVDYAGRSRSMKAYGFLERPIENEVMSSGSFIDFLSDTFENMERILKPGRSFYIFHSSSNIYEFEIALRKNNLPKRQEIIWDKTRILLGRQDYQWKHEPILYGWKEGAAHYFVSDRTLSTIIGEEPPNLDKMKKSEMKKLLEKFITPEFPTSIIREAQPIKSTEHPMMKPIKLLAHFIKNSSSRNQIVLDQFGGSGSTLITCEQLGRTCYMMELDPKFVDVIIKRWEIATGQKAEKVGSADAA